MFARFTEPARNAVVLAQDEARSLGHNFIGTEHLLLGLIGEQRGLAGRILADLGVQLDAVRADVARLVGSGEEIQPGQIPFTPRAKKTLEEALHAATDMKHDWIGTEHLLLGLTRVPMGLAFQILSDRGSEPPRVRDEVRRRLEGQA